MQTSQTRPPTDDPPFNLEAEMGVLGSVIFDGALLDDVATILRPSDFFRENHALIFQAFLALQADQVPVDINTVAERLRLDGQFEQAGGNDALVEILESVPHAAHAVYYADIVRQKAINRDLIATLTESLTEASSNQFAAGDLLERAESRIFAIGDHRQMVDIATIDDAINDSLARLQDRDEGAVPGLATGFSDYDELTAGFHPGALIVLASRPSIGKTRLRPQRRRAYRAAESGRGACLSAWKWSGASWVTDCSAVSTGIESHRLMHSKRLKDEDRLRIVAAAERLRFGRLFIDDAPTRTVGEICSIARRYRSRQDIGLIVVDYLQLVEAEQTRHWAPRQELVAGMSRRFKILAKNLGIPVLLLSQLNRNAEEREDKIPHMADIRESGAVEQDANVILLLHRPEFYDSNERPGEADLIIAKNRGGQTGTLKFRFQKGITRFSNYDLRRAF